MKKFSFSFFSHAHKTIKSNSEKKGIAKCDFTSFISQAMSGNNVENVNVVAFAQAHNFLLLLLLLSQTCAIFSIYIYLYKSREKNKIKSTKTHLSFTQWICNEWENLRAAHVVVVVSVAQIQ